MLTRYIAAVLATLMLVTTPARPTAKYIPNVVPDHAGIVA